MRVLHGVGTDRWRGKERATARRGRTLERERAILSVGFAAAEAVLRYCEGRENATAAAATTTTYSLSVCEEAQHTALTS